MMRPTPVGLQQFQGCFARALVAGDADSERGDSTAGIAYLVSQPGFSVYRNTVMKACVDALQANYPAVRGLVGDEWFRAAAAIFVRSNLPRLPTLLEYGEGFSVFLGGFGPAAALPYLASVARLDRLWTEAHIACNEPPLEAAAVAGLDTPQLAAAVLTPHASARWAHFEDKKVAAIWQLNRDADTSRDEQALDGPSGGVLIVRPNDAVEIHAFDLAGCAFLDACAHGGPLADAAVASLEADPHADLSRLMARLLNVGAFGRLALPAPMLKERIS